MFVNDYDIISECMFVLSNDMYFIYDMDWIENKDTSKHIKEYEFSRSPEHEYVEKCISNFTPTQRVKVYPVVTAGECAHLTVSFRLYVASA